MDLSWIINHLGEERERYFDAVIPPIVQSAIFAHPDIATMRLRLADEFNAHVYTRGQNPTVEIIAKKLAALEGAERALLFGSGAAAMAAGVLANVRAGDEVVCVEKPYYWTGQLVRKLLAQFGMRGVFVDARDVAAVEAAITPATRMIVLESPNSLTFEQQDLTALARIAQARGIVTLVDNSYATPLGQSPLAHGIDLVAHSATKYLNGHSDVVAGALCGTDTMIRKVFDGPYMTLGAILSPFDAWLLLRGLRTLPVRLERIAATTATVLAHLAHHPKVRRIHAPTAPHALQPAWSATQLHHASGLFSIELDVPEIAAIDRFCNALQRFLMAASWGGYESLVFPVAGVRDWGSLSASASVPINLVRCSIGLEAPDVLIADLERGFAAI
ncbi:MAG TPA: PLP-dependent aspartate aminotransferase family protein [Patescibacteria group bacterium]|nr:PLP-dependent aspartate aminotransferase family protein [Patescibacteria group bacterium]